MTRRIVVSTALAVAVALAGCKSPQPPPTPLPSPPSVPGYGATPPPPTAGAPVPGGAAQRFLTDMDVPGEWWTLFHSPELNALVVEALAANPDVDAAQAALRSARETYYAQKSSAYPTAVGSFAVSRQQVPTYYAPPINANQNEYVYGIHTASLDVAYTPDVFGNVRYQTSSAGAAVDAQRYQTEATYLTLTSNVVGAAVQAAGIRDQIEATNRIVAIERRVLILTRRQRTYAQADGLDVLAQETALRQAEQSLPALQKQLEQTQHLLARLLGRPPSASPAAAFTIASFHLPEDLPLSIPSKLVEQRPDIALAAANLEASSANVGVAYTNRLPNFAINAQTASQALSLFTLFTPATFLSTLTGAVSQTFYDHGTLKHREAAAIAAYDEAAAQYTGAVLSGFQNVADSVVALQTDADALVTATRAEAAAKKSLTIVRAQERVGQISELPVLAAQQTDEQAALTRVQAQAARFTDTAALFQALGGGWWNRTDIAQPGR